MLVISLVAVIKLLLLFLAFMLLGTVGFIMASFRNKVPFVPTPKRIIRMMVDMAGIQPNERICDLGSGTGRIIFTAAKKNKQNLVVGFEKSFTLRLISKFWLWVRPWLKKRVRIIEADFFNLDLFDYNVIFCFLTPEAMRSLAPKFQTLKPGSRLISYMFPLEDTQNFQEAIEHVGDKDSIYYYKKVS